MTATLELPKHAARKRSRAIISPFQWDDLSHAERLAALKGGLEPGIGGGIRWITNVTLLVRQIHRRDRALGGVSRRRGVVADSRNVTSSGGWRVGGSSGGAGSATQGDKANTEHEGERDGNDHDE